MGRFGDQIRFVFKGRAVVTRGDGVDGGIAVWYWHHTTELIGQYQDGSNYVPSNDRRPYDEWILMQSFCMSESTARELLAGLRLIENSPKSNLGDGEIVETTVDVHGGTLWFTRDFRGNFLAKAYYQKVFNDSAWSSKTAWSSFNVRLDAVEGIAGALQVALEDMEELKGRAMKVRL
ncbi:MAG: hypothetical protein R3B49_03705 [Phycisphaerales bacterium]